MCAETKALLLSQPLWSVSSVSEVWSSVSRVFTQSPSQCILKSQDYTYLGGFLSVRIFSLYLCFEPPGFVPVDADLPSRHEWLRYLKGSMSQTWHVFPHGPVFHVVFLYLRKWQLYPSDCSSPTLPNHSWVPFYMPCPMGICYAFGVHPESNLLSFSSGQATALSHLERSCRSLTSAWPPPPGYSQHILIQWELLLFWIFSGS